MTLRSYAVRRIDLSDQLSTQQEFALTAQVFRGGTLISEEDLERVLIEERVMSWFNAPHIHYWFKENVQKEQSPWNPWRFTKDDLEPLLLTCEKVLAASHLVPETMFAKSLNRWPSPTPEALRKARKVIKNVTVAHKLLPAMNDDKREPYDDDYLAAVEDTRDWILRMIADHEESGQRPTFYYYSQ